MYNVCFDCPDCMYDGFAFCCYNRKCKYWSETMRPIPIDIDPLPDIEFYDEEYIDDVFLSV